MIQLDLSQYDELDRLTTKEGPFKHWLADLWAHIEACPPLDPTEIKSFTWRDAYVTEAEERINNQALQLGSHLVYSAKTHFNAVRLTNDDVVPLPTVIKPTIPDSMPVTVKEIA